MADQPATIRDLFMAMPDYANSAAIQNVDKTIQFNVSGEDEGKFYLTVKGGEVTVEEGSADDPDVTIDTPSDVWMAVATGQTNGAVAFMTGKFKAAGDVSLLMSMQNWFNMPS